MEYNFCSSIGLFKLTCVYFNVLQQIVASEVGVSENESKQDIKMEGYLFKRTSNAFKTWVRYAVTNYSPRVPTGFAKIGPIYISMFPVYSHWISEIWKVVGLLYCCTRHAAD